MAKTIKTKLGEDILEIEMNEDAAKIMADQDLDDQEKIKELYKLGLVNNLSRPSEMKDGGIMDLPPMERFKKMYGF